MERSLKIWPGIVGDRYRCSPSPVLRARSEGSRDCYEAAKAGETSRPRLSPHCLQRVKAEFGISSDSTDALETLADLMILQGSQPMFGPIMAPMASTHRRITLSANHISRKKDCCTLVGLGIGLKTSLILWRVYNAAFNRYIIVIRLR